MLIDWFTVAAQFVNFVVLVAILRYFLYGRIVRTVEERDEEIRARLEEAERQKEETARAAEEQAEREREWEEERDERLARVKEETEAKKKELLEQAREEVDELRRRWRESLERDERAFLRDLREGVSKHAFEIASEALTDLADEELQRHFLRAFRKRLRDMPSDRREELRRAVSGSKRGVTVVSAFEIGEDEREELIRAVGEAVEQRLELGFETSPDVICGVELLTDGHKIGFSVGSRMTQLEEWVEESFDTETRGAGQESSAAEGADAWEGSEGTGELETGKRGSPA